MSDYIKRSDALKLLHEFFDSTTLGCVAYDDGWCSACDKRSRCNKYCAVYGFKHIPAADVVPVRRGHWIDKSELISLIEDYGDKCEAFGDYQGQANDEACNRVRNILYEEIDKIYGALSCGTNTEEDVEQK